MNETASPITLSTNNETANLLAMLLGQEGWVKGVTELTVAGSIITKLPDERPSNAAPSWEKDPVGIVLTERQLQVAKKCVTTLIEKGSLRPNRVLLNLMRLLEFTIPDTEAKFAFSLPQVATKYLGDILTMEGKIRRPDDLISAAQVMEKLPIFDQTLTKPENDAALREWVKVPVTLTLTDRQRDVCRTSLKTAAEDGTIRAGKYVQALFGEFGLID